MKSLSLYNKIFLIFVISLVLSLSIIAWYGFNSTSKAYIKAAYENSYQNTATLEIAIESKLSHVPKDLIFVTDFYALKKFMTLKMMGEEIKAKKWKEVFSDTLLDFLYAKKDYYQARVIGLDGNEIISAQYIKSLDKTVLIEEMSLQNKKGRDYVEITKTLKKGEFYISNMSLNIENEEIETPFVPVIRYSTPIFGSNEEVVAVFVLNFYAQSILDLVNTQVNLDKDKKISYYLVNNNGNYIYHIRDQKRWSEQLEHPFNFNIEHFNLKNTLKNQEHGSFSSNGKIYSFHKIQSSFHNKNKFYYIISSVEEAVSLVDLEEFKSMFVIIILLVILLSFFIVRFFILRITEPITLVTKQLNYLSRGEIQKEDIIYSSNDEVGQIVQSTQKVISSIEKIIRQANFVADGELDEELELLGENDELGLAINNMTKRLQEIEKLAQNLSQGNYDANIVAKSSHDKLSIALIDMIIYLQKVTKLSESIAKGNIELDYKAIGQEDRLGIAMLKMVAYLKTIAKQANAISKNDFSQTIKVKSENDVLSSAMVTMTSILSSNHTRNKEELYFSEGIGEFSDKLRGIDDVKILSQTAIAMASRYVNGASGLIYIYDSETNLLNQIASFAHISRMDTMQFKLGEGVVGQVAQDKHQILLQNFKNEYIPSIESGTVLAKPQEMFVFPLVHDGELFGVAEIMSFSTFSKTQCDYLLKMGGIFATLLHSTSQNTQIKILLEKSQRAFEELQTQSYELEKASNYKSEFLANMSHELRTPLNSIILLSKLLTKNLENNLNSKDIDKAKVINKSGNDLLFLINDILDFTKIESGNMELDKTKVHSNDLVDEMNGLFSEIAKEKKIDFIVEDKYNSSFMSDKSKLGQVLKNILSNAMKFTNKGSVYFGIYKENNNIKIIVKDTGIGIAEDKLATIFEAFKQVDGSISREFGGTGLGLSITKTIVDLMNGKVIVKSKLAKGTSFVVELPFESVRKEIVDTEGSKKVLDLILKDESNTASYEDELSEKNILIVDDDSRNIFTLTSVLESSGAEVFSAFNAVEAIELLEKENEEINLIFMDDVVSIKTLKSNAKYKNIPIVSIVANTNIEDKEDCLNTGANEYLLKPVEHAKLFSTIKAMIK